MSAAAVQPSTSPSKTDLENRMLAPFFVWTFAITWGLSILLFAFIDQVTAIFGELSLSNPLIILLIYAPGIVGLLLVLRLYGLQGLGRFFRRLTLWQAPAAWWLYLALGAPAIVFIAAAFKGTLDTAFQFSPWYLALPALAQALVLGPIEEFGWRGVALPLLQRRFAPVWAGLILGVLWAAWHIPSFFAAGMPQSSWDILPYLLGIVAISVILTPFFNAARGSLLVAILYHFQMMNPLWPDAQPWDNWTFVALALIIVILNRKTMFDRRSAATDILLPEDGD